MTRTRKLVLSASAFIVGLCLVALTGGIAVLRTDWFRDQVRLRILREVESATGGRAEIGEFRFDWDQMRAELRSFVLHGTEPEQEQPLLRINSVQVGLKIISIFRRDVDLQSLLISEPRLRVIVDKDGRTNFPQPEVSQRHKRPIERFLALAIDRFQIDDGLIEVNDRRIPLDVSGERLSSRLLYEAAGPRYTGDVSFRRLRLSSPAPFAAAMDADVSLSLEPDRLLLKEARLRTERSSAKLTGAVEGLLAPRVDASVEAKISLSEAQELAKLPALARGTVDFAGRLTYAGLSDYSLSGRMTGTALSAEAEGAKVSPLGVVSEMKLHPTGIEIPRFSVFGLGGKFGGQAQFDKQQRFRLAGAIEQVRLSELAAVRKMRQLPWDGLVSGPFTMEGVLAGGKAREVKLNGRFDVEPAEPAPPLRGLVEVSFDQRMGTLTFGDSQLATAASTVRFSGAPDDRLQVDLESKDLSDVLPAASYFGSSPPPRLPLSLNNGSARFKGTVSGGIDNPRVAGHVSLRGFVYDTHAFDRLEADIVASRSSLQASRLVVEQGQARMQGQAGLTLVDWKPSDTGPVSGELDLRALPLEKITADVGAELPVTGVVAGTFQVAGTPREPQVSAKLTVTKASAYGQPIDQIRVQARYASRSLLVESLEAEMKGSRVRASGVFTHREGDWRSGSLRFEASGNGVRLADLRAAVHLPEELDGTLEVQAKGAGPVENARALLSELQGKASVRKVTWEGRVAGDLQAAAESRAGQLVLTATGDLLGSKVKAEGSCELRDKYPFRGELSFSRISLSKLRPWLGPGGDALPPIEASADGRAYLTGSALEPDGWSARVEMPGVEILPPLETKGLVPGLRNVGLVVLNLTKKSVRVMAGHFTGPDTNVQVTGGIDLATRLNAYDLRIRGGVNLGILRNLDPNLTASGNSSVDATVRGPRARPEFYGRLEFKGASFYLSNVPNGLENASGVVLLFRDRATIESVTAETGGGKLALKGFIGFGTPQWSYRLQASARNVRVRYPAGVSTSLDAALTLTGTASRSLVGGTVTILRSGVSPEVDLAALLASSAQPFVTPAIRNEILRGMQFDVRVETAPNARFDTMLTRDIQAEANLRLLGTPYKPVLAGRINLNQGEVNFLGNRYTISRGEISFLNPVRLEPVLNLDLETRVRGIDVTLSFTGPADRLNLTYRSDPPLQPQEIIALLAVGRAPTSDPTLLARQSERDQSWSQIGASTLVGQALDAAVTSRVQRFFGVSRIKIDPKLTGLANKPGAQLTLEQQVSRDLTFTYVSSLAQEQPLLVRVEWNVSRQWSLLAVRDENGFFGVEVQFKRQFK